MQFQHHPDGTIYLDNGNGRIGISLTDFLIDEPDYPGLINGATGLIYEPGGRHTASDAAGNAMAGFVDPALLDGYIANAQTYVANAAARHAPPAAAFADTQAHALSEVDAQAEAQRLLLITAGSGQAMSYQVKAEEANDCLANHSAASPPPTGTYLLLDSEVGIMANADATLTADAYEVAVVVDATRQAWLQAEAAINAVRVQAKADVKAAATTADVDAVLAAIVWP